MEWTDNLTEDLVTRVKLTDAPKCCKCPATDPLFLMACLNCQQIYCCGTHNDWRDHGCVDEVYQPVADQHADRLHASELDSIVLKYEDPNSCSIDTMVGMLKKYGSNGVFPRKNLYNRLIRYERGKDALNELEIQEIQKKIRMQVAVAWHHGGISCKMFPNKSDAQDFFNRKNGGDHATIMFDYDKNVIRSYGYQSVINILLDYMKRYNFSNSYIDNRPVIPNCQTS